MMMNDVLVLDPETGIASDGSTWVLHKAHRREPQVLDYRTSYERTGKCSCGNKGTCGTCHTARPDGR